MTNEQNNEQTPKKKNGCLIGCGCLLAVIFGIILLVAVIAIFTVSSIKSAVQPTIDDFFEKYNSRDNSYICENLLPDVSKYDCEGVMNKMYRDLGKELDYNLSVFKGADIKVSSNNGKTQKFITTTGNFEKIKDVSLNFEMYVDKSGKTVINYFEYKKD